MCPVRISQRKTRDKHMFSGMHTIAAGSEPCRHLRSAPETDIRSDAMNGRELPIPVGPLFGKAIWQRTFEAASCGHTTSDRSASQSL
jgi:hypothetical protein